MLKEVFVPVVYQKNPLVEHQRKLGMNVSPSAEPIKEGHECDSYAGALAGLEVLMGNTARELLEVSQISASEVRGILFGQVDKRFKLASE